MIYTKVARIISDTQVVLAAGSENGVEEGKEFIIFQFSDPIPDPETGESLGQLEFVKGRVVVTHVQDKVSVATTKTRQVTRRIPPVSESASVSRLLGGYDVSETVADRLKVEGAVALETDPTVRVGDAVRSVE